MADTQKAQPEQEEKEDTSNSSGEDSTSSGSYANKEKLLNKKGLGSALPMPGGRYGKIAAKLLKKHKKTAIGGGLIGLILAAIFLLSGLLAPLKLMHMASNIEDVRMARMHYSLDKRSNRFITSMLAAEMAGEKDGKNRYFQAKGWGAKHPFTQWFRDMKVNKFLETMERNQGARFIREKAPDGPDRLVKINVKGEELDFKRGGVINPDDADFLERRVSETFDNNKDARRALKQAIRQESKYIGVIERRFVRRWMMETLGVRKWRFFEGTRDNVRNKVRDRWTNRVTTRARSGAFLRCVLGGKAKCPKTSSLNDPDNHTRPGSGGKRAEQARQAIDDGVEESRNKNKTGKSVVKRSGIGKTGIMISRQMVSKFIPFVNIAEGIMILVTVDHLLNDGGLVKLIAVSRQAEYASSWMTFQNQNDNLKAGGDKVSGEEVGATMEMWDGIEKSEGYQQVFDQKTSSNAVAQNPEPNAVLAQNEEDDETVDGSEFAEVTDDLKVNNADNNAQKITDIYQSTVGKVLGPIVSVCNMQARPAPVSLCDAADAVSKVVGKILEFVLGIAGSALSFVTPDDVEENAKETLNSIVTTIGEWIFTSLGGAPVCTGEESGGQLFNCIDGGAAVTQEQFLQSAGGSELTQEQVANLEYSVAQSKIRDKKQQSLWKRYASIDNHNSLISRLIIQLPVTKQNMKKSIASIFVYSPDKIAAGAVTTTKNLFSANGSQAYADQHTDNLYGVKRYGFTEAQLNQEPFGGKSEAQCNKETSQFEEALASNDEEKMDEASSICMLDKTVATGLKSMFTDEDDGGIGADPASESPSEENGGGGGSLPSGTTQELAQQIINSQNVTGDSRYIGHIQKVAEGQPPCNKPGANLSKTILGIITAMAEDYSFYITSMNRYCTGKITESGEASYHYGQGGGRAVDFGSINGVKVTDGPGGKEMTRKFVQDLVKLLPNGSGIGQSNCNLGLNLPSGIRHFKDKCHHLHIQVP